LDITYLHTILYDILLYSFWFLTFTLYGTIVPKLLKGMENIDIVELQTSMSAEQAELTLQTLQSTITQFILLTILLVLLILASYALFKGLIWTKILKKKFTWKYFRKFIALNLLYVLFAVVVFILPVLLVLLGIKAGFWLLFLQIIIGIILIMYFYFRTISNILFAKTKKISSFFKSFEKGADKFKKLIIPLLYIVLIFMIISLISMILNIFPEIIVMIFSSILLLAFISWARIYFVKLI